MCEAGPNSLLAQEVAEVGDRVLRVADKLALRLAAVQLLALDVREDRGNLAVSVLVGDDLGLALLFAVSLCLRLPGTRPLTLEVKAMELYEFPNEMPIATRWAGSACALMLAVCVVRCAAALENFRVFYSNKSGVRSGAELKCREFAALIVEFCLGRARNAVFEFLTSARPPQTNPAVSAVQKLQVRAR